MWTRPQTLVLLIYLNEDKTFPSLSFFLELCIKLVLRTGPVSSPILKRLHARDSFCCWFNLKNQGFYYWYWQSSGAKLFDRLRIRLHSFE